MPATKSSGVDKFFRQIVEWVQQVLGQKKQKYQPQKILREHSSSLTRLLLLERDTPRAIRTWRSVPKNTDYDVLLTCDHLYKVSGEPAIEKANPQATHRLAVIQVSRIPGPKGSKRITPVWGGDFNFVAAGMGSADLHRYAIVITDAIAKQLLGVPDDQIDWLWEVSSYTKQYVGNTIVVPTPATEGSTTVSVKPVTPKSSSTGTGTKSARPKPPVSGQQPVKPGSRPKKSSQ